jgi:hypothetical protein
MSAAFATSRSAWQASCPNASNACRRWCATGPAETIGTSSVYRRVQVTTVSIKTNMLKEIIPNDIHKGCGAFQTAWFLALIVKVINASGSLDKITVIASASR